MRATPAIRLAALVLGGCSLGLGCSKSPPGVGECKPSDRSAPASQRLAPRTLEPAPTARPITIATRRPVHLSRIVLYEQPVSRSSSAPRIVELGATPDAATGGMIREPGMKPPEVREPDVVPSLDAVPHVSTAAPKAALPRENEEPAASGMNSSYVPLEAPPPTMPLVDSPPPPLPAEPTFQSFRENQPPPPAAPSPRQPAPKPEITADAAPPPSWGESESPNNPSSLTAGTGYVPLQVAPVAAPPTDHTALRAAAERAAQISDRGFAMAQRGMVFAGQEELIKSLQLLAQALDVQDGSGSHAAALSRGLDALREARDFATAPTALGTSANVAEVAATHRTALLRSAATSLEVPPVAAQQQYLAFAQSQLAVAGGNQPVASQTLYRLGRLQGALAAHNDDPQALHAPQAMVFHQAALSVEGTNYLAANELGVLLARYGQLEDARRLLLHSVSQHPQVETWQNLAAVHRRLGEGDLARRADAERDLLAKQTGSAEARKVGDLVRWVDPPTFAASGPKEIPWPEHTATKANDPSSAAGQRR